MSALNGLISDTTTKQQLELITALAEIQGGSSNALADFTRDSRQSLMNTIMQEHSDTAVNNVGNLSRAQDSINNIMYYYARNQDVNTIQTQILERAKSEAQGSVHDSQLSKRQFEMNEWSASNKAETVFMMQLLLITVTFTIFLLFLNRIGLIPTSIFSLVAGLLFIAFVITFIVRNQYTNNFRDNRYWNRKNYGHMEKITPAGNCINPDPTGTQSSTNLFAELINVGEAATNAVEAGLTGLVGVGSTVSGTFNSSLNNLNSGT